MALALITGASRGFGLALAKGLAQQGWDLIVDARDAHALKVATGAIGPGSPRSPVTSPTPRTGGSWRPQSPGGRAGPAGQQRQHPRPQPSPGLDATRWASWSGLRTNTLAPLALIQDLLPTLAAGGAVVNVTSDAAVEAYEGWGGYGASKAALDQLRRCSGPSSRSSGSTPSTPATCAPPCTRLPSPARTSPTGRSRRRSCLRCCGCWTTRRPAAATARPTCWWAPCRRRR